MKLYDIQLYASSTTELSYTGVRHMCYYFNVSSNLSCLNKDKVVMNWIFKGKTKKFETDQKKSAIFIETEKNVINDGLAKAKRMSLSDFDSAF
jgi:hypothetical protein